MYPYHWMHQDSYMHAYLFSPFFWGPWWLAGLVFWCVVIGIPVGRILGRMGWSPWLAILAFIPLVNVIFLWVAAMSKWPNDRRPDA